MKYFIAFFIFGVIGFALGYAYSNNAILSDEFAEATSTPLVHNMMERISFRSLAESQEYEKLTVALDTLIYGDLIAIESMDFVDTKNSALLCKQFERLNQHANTEDVFYSKLQDLLNQCK